MPNGILNPNDFTIAPGSMRSLEDKILEYKRSLPPSLQGPQVGGQPNMTLPEEQQMAVGRQIGQTVRQLDQQTSIPPVNQPPSLVGDIQELRKGQKKPSKPETYGGSQIGQFLFGEDKGGIFGTGIQPVDVLAFALGAAITSKMPQDKAIATTMAFAKMPSQFREHMKSAEDEFVDRQIKLMNAEVGATNVEVAQSKAAQAKNQFDASMKVADILEQAGEPTKAAAFRANRVDDYLKLVGGDVSKIPTVSYLDTIRGIASGAIPVPDWYMKRTNSRTQEEGRASAMAEYEAKLMESPAVPMPGVGAVIKTPQGQQIITEAPVLGQPRGMRDIQRDLEAARRGGVAQIAPQVSTAPAAIAPQEPVRRLEPTPGGGFMPPTPGRPAPIAAPSTSAAPYIGSGQLIDQLSKSPSKQDQWVAKYHSDTPAEVQVKMVPLFQRPMDAGDRQKLVAQASALNFGEKLLDKYEKMVESVGGEKNMKFTGNMKRYVNELSTRISAEGATASLIGIASDFASAWSQRGGQKFTPEEEDFMAHYAQAQSYARGAMQDAANLATRERDMFRNMIGTLLDTPSMYRSRVNNFLSNVGDNYNILLKANKLKASDGFEPYTPPKLTREPPKWFKPLQIPQQQTQPGGEY